MLEGFARKLLHTRIAESIPSSRWQQLGCPPASQVHVPYQASRDTPQEFWLCHGLVWNCTPRCCFCKAPNGLKNAVNGLVLAWIGLENLASSVCRCTWQVLESCQSVFSRLRRRCALHPQPNCIKAVNACFVFQVAEGLCPDVGQIGCKAIH